MKKPCRQKFNKCMPGWSLLALAYVICLVLETSAALGSVVVGSPIFAGTELVGFSSSEPNLYFVPPSGWKLSSAAGRRLWIEESPGEDEILLRFVLAPDFTKSHGWMSQVMAADARSVFFPLPVEPLGVDLFLPDGVHVAADLTPGAASGYLVSGMYFRLTLEREQLELLRTLASQPIFLQGAMALAYVSEGNRAETSVPVTLTVPGDELTTLGDTPVADPGTWIGNLVEDHPMMLRGILDQRFHLGGGVFLTLAQSIVTARFAENGCSIRRDELGFVCNPSFPGNLTGSIKFEISELHYPIALDFSATVTVALDLSTLKVEVPEVSGLEIRNGDVSGHTLLRGLDLTAQIREAIARHLTLELQQRILNHTLFHL